MYKDKLDDLLKRGVLTEAEYNKYFETMNVNDKGELIGAVPSDRFHYKYEFDGNLLDKPLVEFVLEEITVPLDAECIDPLFKTYGFSFFGICDGYHWFTSSEISDEQRNRDYKPIEEASELELWKIVAICSRYWESHYKEWYEHKR